MSPRITPVNMVKKATNDSYAGQYFIRAIDIKGQLYKTGIHIKEVLINHFTGYYPSHSSPRIFYISISAGYQVNVAMENGLTS